MKTSDYQKLRNAISDLQYFGILFEEESKLYQRRVEDLWHGVDQKERPVTERGGVTATEVRRAAILPEPATLVVEDNSQEGIVNVDPTVVLNETKLSEFVPEQIDSGSRCANYIRQHLLRYFGKNH